MKTSNPPFPALTHDEIADRAREIWITRGSPVGQDCEIWYEAERQLAFARGSGQSPVPSNRRTEKRPRAGANAADDINDDELVERLDSVGASPRRSPTSL
jgi:hypothetical protein